MYFLSYKPFFNNLFLDDTDLSESEGFSSAALSKTIDGINIRSPTSVTSETEEESRDGEYRTQLALD